jgi:hypothetical protein
MPALYASSVAELITQSSTHAIFDGALNIQQVATRRMGLKHVYGMVDWT